MRIPRCAVVAAVMCTTMLGLPGLARAADVLANPSSCIKEYESRYLIDGVLSPAGATCQQDAPPFDPGDLPTGFEPVIQPRLVPR